MSKINPVHRLLAAGALIGLASLAGGCSSLERIRNLGEQPALAAIENPTVQPGYKPVHMPMPEPTAAVYNENSLWRSGSREFFKDQRAHQVGDILTVTVNITTDNQTVEVTADAPLIETSSAQVSHTFSGKELSTYAGVSGGTADKNDGVDLRTKQKAQWDRTLKIVQHKFSADLLSYYQCASIGSTPDGKTCAPQASKVVKVNLELTEANTAVVQKLALAGFKVETGKGSLQLTGSILTYRLKQLAQIAEVKSVSLSK